MKQYGESGKDFSRNIADVIEAGHHLAKRYIDKKISKNHTFLEIEIFLQKKEIKLNLTNKTIELELIKEEE